MISNWMFFVSFLVVFYFNFFSGGGGHRDFNYYLLQQIAFPADGYQGFQILSSWHYGKFFKNYTILLNFLQRKYVTAFWRCRCVSTDSTDLPRRVSASHGVLLCDWLRSSCVPMTCLEFSPRVHCVFNAHTACTRHSCSAVTSPKHQCLSAYICDCIRQCWYRTRVCRQIIITR